MANHKSAQKCIRKALKRNAINSSRISRIRGFVKKAEVALGVHQQPVAEPTKALELFTQAQKEMMRGVSKGVLHKNTVARKVSRLAKRLKAIAN